MVLGIHASVREGLAAALDEASSLGCRAMQMLPHRRHDSPSSEDLAGFRSSRQVSGVERLLVHSRYVPSLASSDASRRGRSSQRLAWELGLAAGLGAEAYVLHPGAYSPGGSARAGLGLAAEAIAEAWGRGEGRLPVLVENVPGGGRRLGGSLEELAELLEFLSRRGVLVGACLDTAHAYAAGYDLSSAEGMTGWLARAHRLLGSDGVRAFHLNDTRALLGAHVENHASWGEGRLGSEGLKCLLERAEYAAIPAILETPKGEDRRNLDWVKALLPPQGR